MLKVALVVPRAFDLWNFRRPLIKALRHIGTEVIAITPFDPWVDRLRTLGCTVVEWPLNRRSLSPWTASASCFALYRLYRRIRPTLAHHFTIKPNIYGLSAARAAGVPICLATVTGMGYLWSEESLRIRLVRAMLEPLYRHALRRSDATIFLNEEDRLALSDGQLSVTIPGEGVDLSEFHPNVIHSESASELKGQLVLNDDVMVVLMVSRMLRHKGVREFVAAARILKSRHPRAIFLLVGPLDSGNRGPISADEIRGWEAEGVIRYLGSRNDVRDLMALSEVVVLPSYYREGVPRVLIEGAAMGKPLVAGDVPGSRDAIEESVNGFLVPPRDPTALAEAIGRLLREPATRAQFGRASRELAENRFDQRAVVENILALYSRLLSEKGLALPLCHDLEYAPARFHQPGHLISVQDVSEARLVS